MLADPLAKYSFPFFNKEVSDFSVKYGYRALPLHFHEVILSFALYNTLFFASGFLSPKLSKSYKTLSPKAQINFDIHVVSTIQSILILILSFPLFGDETLAVDRINAYTPYAGFVGAMATGYFLWDSIICIRYVHMFGVGFMVHGVAALFVFIQGFRPYLMWYTPAFLLFEISTPFVNMHWFSTRLPEGTIPEKIQIINGVLLMTTFFSARILWGFYQAYKVLMDLLYLQSPITEGTMMPPVSHPWWVPVAVLGSNVSLDILNVYWFSKMVRIVKRRIAAEKRKDTDKKNA